MNKQEILRSPLSQFIPFYAMLAVVVIWTIWSIIQSEILHVGNSANIFVWMFFMIIMLATGIATSITSWLTKKFAPPQSFIKTQYILFTIQIVILIGFMSWTGFTVNK